MSILTAPIYKLVELNNLFIEMTAKNCNQHCKNCYIDFPLSKSVKDFIPVEKIKDALYDTKNENLYCIYLSGAEPMTHPDFNQILRLCLKRSNVCICTNGSFLNEKKVRFLNKVENEGSNQIFFSLSLAHFDEIESDKVKYRGNYRQTMFALKTLGNYNFNSVLSLMNYYKLPVNEINENFRRIFSEYGITNVDLKITNCYPNFDEKNFTEPAKQTDCMRGRVLSVSGVYSCPFLASDYRGRCGSDFKNYTKNISAETEFCAACSKNVTEMFTIG